MLSGQEFIKHDTWKNGDEVVVSSENGDKI